MSIRIKHDVKSTIDGVQLYAASIGVSGTATGLTTTLMDSTELHSTVSGTSPGVVFLTLPKPYDFPQLVSWTANLRAGSTSSANFGGQNELTKEHYVLERTAFQYSTGAPIVDGTAGYYANPNTSTDPRAAAFGGGSVFKMQINKLVQSTGSFAGVAPISASLANPIDASVAPGHPTAVIDVVAVFRNRSRVS